MSENRRPLIPNAQALLESIVDSKPISSIKAENDSLYDFLDGLNINFENLSQINLFLAKNELNLKKSNKISK